jgi:putative restriction endonuclease
MLLRYKYEGTNPDRYTNVGLRRAYETQVPLIWFVGVQQGLYEPVFPVWIVADEPDRLQVAVALDQDQRRLIPGGTISAIERSYAARIARQRLHQPVFRQRVIQAYQASCAMCLLRHRSLLDAAHIIPDREDRGIPAVSNGLALCKIHHAAYDENILGVRPDLVVEVRTDILDEIDGPMLKHGLQEMNDRPLSLPHHRADHPNASAIEERYERFRAAG